MWGGRGVVKAKNEEGFFRITSLRVVNVVMVMILILVMVVLVILVVILFAVVNVVEVAIVLVVIHPSQMSYPVQKSCNVHFLSY